MKLFKKVLMTILFLLLFTLLASCIETVSNNDTDSEEKGDEDSGAADESDSIVNIAEIGKCKYSIAFKNSSDVKSFEKYARAIYGIIAVDYFVTVEKYDSDTKVLENEILIGNTDRPLSLELKSAVDKEAGTQNDFVWGYAYKDGKLAFYANSEYGAELGFPEFKALCYNNGEFSVSEELWVIGKKSRAEYNAEQERLEAELKGEKNIVIDKNSALLDLHPNASIGICGSVKGSLSSYVLTLPSKIVMTGDLKIDNITLAGSCTVFANGYKLEITNSVYTSSGRLTVYGGAESGMLNGDTELILLGAKYASIYGGSSSGTVNGNTNITLGGSANAGDSIDDSSSAKSLCMVYGGNRSGTVNGTSNITLKDNAIALYIVGSSGSGVKASNIRIEGGKVMNVYGGARSSTVTMSVSITMTGGLAESIFGGCEGAAMTGDVNIALLGGDVSRRVYAGCYNGYNGSFTTSHYVTGRLTVTIGPNAKLASGKELSSDNQSDMGIFASSRIGSRAQAEVGTVIFLDGCYSAQSGKLGAQCFWFWDIACSDSYHLYEINCTAGGDVYAYGTENKLAIMPDIGYQCTLNGNNYLHSADKSQNLYTLPSTSSVVKLDVSFARQ